MREKVLIKGAGEQASGAAHRLFRCGYRIVMTDLASPTAVRRSVSFCSAVYDKGIVVEGVRAAGYRLDQADVLDSFDWTHIPVFVDPQCKLRELWKPDVIIDGRILKKNLDNDIAHARLVIGFGPGLIAGRDVHFVVETQRGHDLGRIIADGAAASDTRVPGPIGGYTSARVVRAPVDGTFRTSRNIGDCADIGAEVGQVDQCSVTAQVAGVLRGLLRSGTTVVAGQKLGDIDPRGNAGCCRTLSDKARTISGSALEIILASFDRGRAS